MIVYSLQQLVAIARHASPFYRRLYRNLGPTFQLENLPIARFEDVMRAVHADFRSLFTHERLSGMFYTTSGTTGRPKATLFGREEWRPINRLLATQGPDPRITRLQAPAIRMYTGDNALWRDPPGARFALCGRRFVNRYPLAAAELDSRQVGALIKRLLPHLPLLMLWLEITGCGDRPQVTIALSLYGLAAPPADLERRVLMAWENVAPAIAAEVQRQHLPPPRVRLVDFSYFAQAYKRKIPPIVDKRLAPRHGGNPLPGQPH